MIGMHGLYALVEVNSDTDLPERWASARRFFRAESREVVNKSFSAPTERAMSAQGNALGINVTTIRSPERAR